MKTILKSFNSVLYPNTCICCGSIIEDGEFLCDYCHEFIELTDPLKRCKACGMNKSNCQCKRHVFYFNSAVAPFVNKGVAKRVMYIFKFGKREQSSEFFARQMAFCVKNEYRDISFDCITYVPMSKRKLAKRSYNQSFLLAKDISERLNIPIFSLLKARHSYKSQHSLREKQRFKNVKGMYSAKCKLDGKRILLVDDIKTTGATLDECSKALLVAGADAVYCVTALISQKNKKRKGK